MKVVFTPNLNIRHILTVCDAWFCIQHWGILLLAVLGLLCSLVSTVFGEMFAPHLFALEQYTGHMKHNTKMMTTKALQTQAPEISAQLNWGGWVLCQACADMVIEDPSYAWVEFLLHTRSSSEIWPTFISLNKFFPIQFNLLNCWLEYYGYKTLDIISVYRYEYFI